MKLNREQMYDLYKQVYEKLERKEMFIDDYITSVHQKLSRPGSNEASSSSTTQISMEEQTVRTFPIIENPRRKKILFLGVAVSKIGNRQTIPTDITVHAYRGWTKIEKMDILKKYPETKIKIEILQDGTNSFLKFELKPRDVFEQYKQMVKIYRE